jgi:tRNA dimethylallyltransferase
MVAHQSIILYTIKKPELVAVSGKDMSNKLLVVIGGPTGVGKTAMAIRLAQHYRTEIVSADSRQVYEELIIGVGRPSPDQLNAVPHHLIGNTTIFGHYSAGHYTKDALAVLEHLFQTHEIVILTGGTGLYVKSIMEGFDDIPEVPEEITEKWTTYWKENGTESLVNVLRKVDPDYLNIVDPKNHMRLIRAIAVSVHVGKPFSSFRKGEYVNRPFNIIPIVLELPREELYQRIDQRVLEMMEAGWLEEAKKLFASRHLKALQTVGYKELFEYLEGKLSLADAIAAIQQSTRHYAKRQTTWWRHQGSWQNFKTNDMAGVIKAIDQF